MTRRCQGGVPRFVVALALLLVAIGDGCGRLGFEELEPLRGGVPGTGDPVAQADAAVSGTGGLFPSDGSATGGAPATGGASATGGAPATGGASATGGAPATGGASATGGAPATGGASATGGAPATGGASATGGAPATGGASATGGAPATGGASATGGAPATGGASATGGAPATGGSGPSCTPSNGGVEICDGLDNDCAGGVDNGGACETGCSGWIFQGASYMFCTPLSLLSAARARCAAVGMRLLRIDSAVENEWVRLTGQMLQASRVYWLGASDLAREGTWLWEDGTQFWMGDDSGTAIGGRYHNWNPGEPGGGVGESCAQILSAGVWNDTSCINLLGTICKRY